MGQGALGGSGGLRGPTLSVLCRARTACTLSLMCGFLLRRTKDFRHCSCVRKRRCPIRDTPPCLRHCIRLSRSSPAGSGQREGALEQEGSPQTLQRSPCPEGVGSWSGWGWEGP